MTSHDISEGTGPTAATPASLSIQVDIVSDVVCPWCIIGYRQFIRALEQTGGAVRAGIRWHPFELNPQMPPEGQDLREHIAAKYGSTPEQSASARKRITEIGERLGFAFRYTDQSRMYNTFRAHQLLHWATEHGKQTALKLALFAAYFTDQKDPNDTGVLLAIVEAVGLDRAEAAAVLADQRYAETVRQHEQFWLSRGVQGVPAFVFDQRYMVTGAQEAEVFLQVFERLANDRAA